MKLFKIPISAEAAQAIQSFGHLVVHKWRDPKTREERCEIVVRHAQFAGHDIGVVFKDKREALDVCRELTDGFESIEADTVETKPGSGYTADLP